MRKLSLLLFLFTAIRTFAQLPLTSDNKRAFSGAFDKDAKSDPLDCHIEPMKPFFDFAFRFEIGYVARCSIRQFEGKATNLGALLRISPEGARPSFLGQRLTLPDISPEMREKIQWQHLNAEFEFSGVFAAGEGDYAIDLAIVDGHHRVRRKSWRAKAFVHGKEQQATQALKPGAIAAISLPFWKGTSTEGNGLHLTVLLDAAPMNPYSRRLRAWDGAFLLGSVSSLLRHLPVASVRLVAFNLDQQAEIYRDDDFDHSGLLRLAQALSKLELGTISYKTLQRQNGWAGLLVKLVREETVAEHPSDAVIFIGPTNRIDAKIPPESVNIARRNDVPVFYFEYYPRIGSEFPDTIQHLTDAQKGTTFRIHSPGELADAIGKMERKLNVKAGLVRESQ